MKEAKCLAVQIGDHSGQPARDVAPDKTPVTLFDADGNAWHVVDLDSRIVNAYRQLAVRDGVSLNELLSAALVKQLTLWLETK